MARKIGVFKAGQSTGQPRTYIKKSIAKLLIRRNLAEWVTINLILRMRNELQPGKAIDFLPQASHYIPDRLPSHKTPGTKAIGPVVERSRERQELIRAARHEILWGPIERSGISAIVRPIL